MWYVYVTTQAGRHRLPYSYRTKRVAERVAADCRKAIVGLVRVEVVKGLNR